MNYESITTHKVRLRGLIAELEAEEGAEQGGGGGRSYVLLHLRALQDEVGWEIMISADLLWGRLRRTASHST